MTRKYTNRGKLKETMIAKYKRANPGISNEEAYDLWREDLRKRGSMGGKKSTGAFAVVEGLAQRAGRLSRAKSK